MKKLNKIKNYKGITLIALIITIILILILASTTVTVAINGGLFSYAGKAKQDTEIASEKETVQKASILAESTSKTGKVTVEDMQKAINSITEENTAIAMNNIDTIVVKFNESNRYYEIYRNGNVEGPIEIETDKTPGALDGTGTEGDPYVIMSIEDLVYFSKQTNENNTYANKYIILGRSLDFNSELSYVDYKTTEYDEYLGGDGTTGLKEQLTNGNGFKPISYNKTQSRGFQGEFDGKNNIIYNIKVNVIEGAGLFDSINGARISNLTVTGEIKGTRGVAADVGAGGIIGRSCGSSIIFNCYNFCNVYGNTYKGGIVGNSRGATKIVNCCNAGKIELNGDTFYSYTSAGGIIGIGGGEETVINCYNLETVENYCTTVYAGAGGIIGNTAGSTDTIINCYNIGKIIGQHTQGSIAGGFWYSDWISTLNNCYYLEDSCDKAVGSKSMNITEGTFSCTKNYMQSDEFISELNSFVDTYNEEHKEDEDFIKLSNWEKGINGYPSLINEIEGSY